MELLHLKWPDVSPDPTQPRANFDPQHLESIEATYRERGQLVPAMVRREGEAFVILDGECRWRVGRKLHDAHPDNPLYATFPAYVVDELREGDRAIVQYIANSGADLTPAEKLTVLQRLLSAGVPKNKLRKTLGITQGQYRYLREFLKAPAWLHSYGQPRSVSIPLTDDDGNPVRNNDGQLENREHVVAPLPLTHLAILSRAAVRLMKWDQEQQLAHPEGDHANRAQTSITRVAEKALREGWSSHKLAKACTTVVRRIVEPPSPDTVAPDLRPFIWSPTGGFRVPTTDPEQLPSESLDALVAELETLLSKLRAASISPTATAGATDAKQTGAA